MTITNFKATLNGSVVTCSWDATDDYSFLYADAEMIKALPIGETSYSTSYVSGAIYQAVDSATSSPIPEQLEPVPPRYLQISWEESSETDLAKYEVVLNGSPVKYVNAGSSSYSYRTPRLDSGENTIVVIAIDAVGNKLSEVSTLSYEIESVPLPIQSLSLSQSGAGNITATITPPDGW